MERWFGELTSGNPARLFRSVRRISAIQEFLAAWNKNPKPFVWTATVESIVEKLTVAARLSNKFSPAVQAPRPAAICPVIRGHYTSVLTA